MDQDLGFMYPILYILLCCCTIYPPAEFVSAGFTIPVLFSSYLGVEEDGFINYHIKRSYLTLLVYSLLPFGYVAGLILFNGIGDLLVFAQENFLGRTFLVVSIILPLMALYQIYVWSKNNHEKHPIAVNLSKFCNNNMNWRSVQINIDAEFLNIDKVYFRINPITHMVITENWILKVTPLTIFAAHQSDANLIVKTADTHETPSINIETRQFLNIEVNSSRAGVNPFVIRINAVDFRNLQNRLTRNITILPNVKFHKSNIERFIDVFKQSIKSNPRYQTEQAFENCIGCLEASPNVKLQKLCNEETPGDNKCTSCYCRPMWCVDCMAKWFVSRQDAGDPSSWLSSKCTCPMCRAKFCLLDVCFLNTVDVSNDTEE